MKLTKTKLKQLIKEELKALRSEGAYEDDPSFQQGVDNEYRDDADPRTLGDLAAQLGVDDIEKYFQDMGFMIVPVEDMQMDPDASMDYEAAASKKPYYDKAGDFTGGMGRKQGLEERRKKKLTKSKLKRMVKEELNKVLESDEMVYAGGTQEPGYDDLAKAGGVVKDYLSGMRNPIPSTMWDIGADGKPVIGDDGKRAEVQTSELLKSLWDFMRDNPDDTDGERTKAEAMKLGFGEFYAGDLAKKYAGKVNSTSPTGDMMMRAAVAKGPVAPDARTLPGGSK